MLSAAAILDVKLVNLRLLVFIYVVQSRASCDTTSSSPFLCYRDQSQAGADVNSPNLDIAAGYHSSKW